MLWIMRLWSVGLQFPALSSDSCASAMNEAFCNYSDSALLILTKMNENRTKGLVGMINKFAPTAVLSYELCDLCSQDNVTTCNKQYIHGFG